jgi:hypothetical protein
MIKGVFCLGIVGLFVFFLLACSKDRASADPKSYTILKIDSITNYYLVYGSRNDSIFKIVSKKENSAGVCQKIQPGKKYALNLRSSIITGKNITPATNDLVQCIGFDSTTTICFEDSCVQDLFRTYNLKGLCHQLESTDRN